MLKNDKKYLFISPHADDVEHGCAGTISKLIRRGTSAENIYIVIFSICAESLPKGFKNDVMKSEALQSVRKMKLRSDKEHLIIFNFKVRNFPENRQQILNTLIDLRKKIKPDYVFAPTTTDIHQDHQTITQESMRTFKITASLFGYEILHNNFKSHNHLFVKLTDRDIEIKIKAIECYKSQLAKTENGTLAKRLTSLANVRGQMVNSEYVEMFEVIRVIE